MDINKDFLNDMDDDLKAKVAACETPEDIQTLAKAEGVELSDEQLDSISGGSWTNTSECGHVYEAHTSNTR